MKLVQLLAKELKEWPEGVDVYAQDDNGKIYPWVGIPQLDEEEWLGAVGTTIHQGDSWSGGEGMTLCEDHMTANVTKSQWQAEREKMNKPKWIRHRGGKCPVKAGTKVVTRYRDGVVSDWCMTRDQDTSEEWLSAVWSHSGGETDIMAYYVEETKDQAIEEVKKTNFGTLTYKLEIDATDATQRIDSLVAKWGQIVSPIKWRDAIIHCQAIIEDCEREIERNVNLLDAEGLMMRKDSNKAMQHYQTDIDMSDWRNWQAGDIFEVVKKTAYFTVGNHYSVKYTANTDAPITATDDDGDELCLLMEEIKFIRRP